MGAKQTRRVCLDQAITFLDAQGLAIGFIKPNYAYYLMQESRH